MSVILNSDHCSRISMKTVVHALEQTELVYGKYFTQEKAMKAFDAEVSKEPVTEAMQMNHCNAIAVRVMKAFCPVTWLPCSAALKVASVAGHSSDRHGRSLPARTATNGGLPAVTARQ